MAQVRQIFYDSLGDILVVWFDNPNDKYEVEEIVLLMTNKNRKVIYLENT